MKKRVRATRHPHFHLRYRSCGIQKQAALYSNSTCSEKLFQTDCCTVVRNAFCIPVYIFKNIATCIGFHISDSNTYQLKKTALRIEQQIMAQMLQDVIVWHALGVQLRYSSKGKSERRKKTISSCFESRPL